MPPVELAAWTLLIENLTEAVWLVQADTQRVQEAGGRNAANVLRVLDALRHRPMCSLRQIGAITGITFPTASKAMLALVDIGIARELTGQRRNRVFVYDAYLHVLNENGDAL